MSRFSYTEAWYAWKFYRLAIRILGAILAAVSFVVLCFLVNLYPDDADGIILGYVALVIIVSGGLAVYFARKAFKGRPAYDPSTDMEFSRWRWDAEKGGPVRDE